MSEKTPVEKPKNNELVPQKQLIPEDEYIKKCTEYALSLGWIKPEQESLLIEKYLRPIYHHCISIITDVIKNGVIERNNYNRIINKLNWCLDSTRRIGSTYHGNILRTILDYKRETVTDEEEYAIQSFYEFVEQLLNS